MFFEYLHLDFLRKLHIYIFIMSGMFWHNNYSPSIKISLMLHEKEITLKKLMDDDNILQECRAQNKKLLKFLTRLDILEELINLIIEEPSQDIDERWRYKYSNIACELLTCEVSILTEKLAGNEMLMSKLYSFIDKEQPLNPLLASFFSKTVHTLLRRTSYQNWFSYQFACLQVLESFKNRKNWIDLLLQHIQTSAIMDLILVLVTKIESHEISQNISNWLDDQQLIQRLIKLLSPNSDSEKHANASQLLSDIVKSSRLEGENRSYSIYQTIQSILSGEKIESSIIGGIKILINLIGQTESSDSYGVPFNNIVEDEKRDKFTMIIIPYLEKLNLLLLDPPKVCLIILYISHQLGAGILEKPFGPCRLHILKLFVKFLSTKNPKILEKFATFNTFQILLDLFFQFSWNNFLHTQVQQCLSLAISCNCPDKNEIIYFHIFIKSKLIDRILKAWENNDHNSLRNQENGVKQGYMGHLIILVNNIVTRCEENNILSNYLRTNLSEDIIKQWQHFIKTKLDEVNKIQELMLGESSEGYGSSDGNPNECTPFQDFYDVESNTDYQERSLPVYVDEDYNFPMEKFNSRDDTFDSRNSADDFHHQSFNLTTDEFEKKQDLFNQICDEKKFDDIRDNIHWKQGTGLPIDKADLLVKRKHDNSSSSDEEYEENFDNICKKDDVINRTSIKLWYTEVPKPVEETGWANFDDFSGTFSVDVNCSDYSTSKIESDYLEIPIVNNTGNNSNYTENRHDVKKENELEIDGTDLCSISNVDLTTSENIPDNNANVTIIAKRGPESKDIYKHFEESTLNISDYENIKFIQTDTNATDNVSPKTTSFFESTK
ncbi:PREDICTED: serine/threonine-protein phosphatase 6 regulatory subunit 3 [Ceratosolen solmsi marchali]|uniref:Serine/threonine-protein phosphatase 6 regulatory subunit 3 n=1 Tax=Ceratosolen solmsi marchali TaxID=326594 RepID=A0AAJ7DZY0_9HYME|nr:PREDICTED: serine/threonine-protein phosphatase 6 regulatory subunit 3 [Ceratosolen solmsi marchali]